MKENFNEIADLAEDLGEEFLDSLTVDVERLATSHDIQFINGHYGKYFLGLLFYHEQKFYIILNKDLLDQCESGRLRFTIAHELGHYFIPTHKIRIESGVSLSFNKDLDFYTKKRFEIEANHFAANLLMPKKHFRSKIGSYTLGLSGILNLKKDYDTSIESTVNHFINQDMSSVLMIRWKADFSYQYLAGSVSFWKRVGIKKSDFSIRFDSTYVENQLTIIKNTDSEICESTSRLSKWAYNSSENGPNDVLLIEEMIKLGNYGGLVLLTLR